MTSEIDAYLSKCFVGDSNIYFDNLDTADIFINSFDIASTSLVEGKVINYLKNSFETGFYTTAKLFEGLARLNSPDGAKWKKRCVKVLAYPMGFISLLIGSIAIPLILATGFSLLTIAGLILLIRKITDHINHKKTALRDYSILEKLLVFPSLCLIKCLLPTDISSKLSYD